MIKSGVSEGTIFHSEAVSFVHVGKFHYFFTIHYSLFTITSYFPKILTKGKRQVKSEEVISKNPHSYE